MNKNNLKNNRVLNNSLFLTGSFLMLAALSLLLTGCGKKGTGQAHAGATEKGIFVKTQVAQGARIAEVTRVPVTIQAAQQTNLSFEMGGTVKQVPVKLGDKVKKGDLLIQLDEVNIRNQIKQAESALQVAKANLANIKAGNRPENIQISEAQLKQAQANLELQAKNLERMKKLYEEELISKQQYDSAVAAYNSAVAQARVAEESLSLAKQGASKETLEVAEAQVKQAAVALEIAESQLEKARLTAPFSGYVTMIKISEGEMAAPGVPVVGLADLSKVNAVGYVGQSMINALSAGQTVSVSVGTNGEVEYINGVLTVLSSMVDPQLRTYEFKIALENASEKLKGGMVGEAFFVVRESNPANPVAPREAVIEYSGEKIVYVVEDGRARARTVTTGVDDGKAVEITSGIKPGDLIVVSGQHYLTDGVLVEVK
ncbi:MAG TPA: efflux RND transporter periplasmic adaptor subunit [Bacillota bacterium]